MGSAHKEELHRRGVRLEVFTMTWNVVEAFVAIGAGLLAGSEAVRAEAAETWVCSYLSLALSSLADAEQVRGAPREHGHRPRLDGGRSPSR